jgi:hypothetical protein
LVYIARRINSRMRSDRLMRDLFDRNILDQVELGYMMVSKPVMPVSGSLNGMC